jgi:hypothetical protein
MGKVLAVGTGILISRVGLFYKGLTKPYGGKPTNSAK